MYQYEINFKGDSKLKIYNTISSVSSPEDEPLPCSPSSSSPESKANLQMKGIVIRNIKAWLQNAQCQKQNP